MCFAMIQQFPQFSIRGLSGMQMRRRERASDFANTAKRIQKEEPGVLFVHCKLVQLLFPRVSRPL